MRGWPPIQAALAFVIILLTGVPVWFVTRSSAVAPVRSAPPAEVRLVKVQITFSEPPESFAIRHLGEVVWQEENPSREISRELKLRWPVEGVDLQVFARWRDSVRWQAVRIRVVDEGDKTLWAQGELEDVVTFH